MQSCMGSGKPLKTRFYGAKESHSQKKRVPRFEIGRNKAMVRVTNAGNWIISNLTPWKTSRGTTSGVTVPRGKRRGEGTI